MSATARLQVLLAALCFATTGKVMAQSKRDLICGDAEFLMPAQYVGIFTESLDCESATVSIGEA